MDNNKIGLNIAKLRKDKGLTQQELGNKLYVTDKAVSKWERGLSLPDIAILEKLANELDTDIYNILLIPKKDSTDLKEILLKERKNIKRQLIKNSLIFVYPIVIVIGIVLFKLIPFGYNIYPFKYVHDTNNLISLGIPKFSFLITNVEDSYSFKSFRGKNIIKSEMKDYINKLEHITCNNTTYFYDADRDISIIDYKVRGNIFYNTGTYSVRLGNYCKYLEEDMIKNKIGAKNKTFNLYSESLPITYNLNLKITRNIDDEMDLKANLISYTNNSKEILENSNGSFNLDNDLLIYHRDAIYEQDSSLNIPDSSVFIMKSDKLILKDNYLKDYKDYIILK